MTSHRPARVFLPTTSEVEERDPGNKGGPAIDMYQENLPPKSSFGSHFKVDDAGAPSSSHKIRFKYGPVTEIKN